MMQQEILQLQNELADNKITSVLNRLKNIFALSSSTLLSDVIILSGQFKKLNSDIRKGIIDYGQENLRHNQIMNAILSLIEELEQDPEQFKVYQQTTEDLDQSIQEKGKPHLPIWIKDALFDRMTYVKEKGLSIRALWIDDLPRHNQHEIKLLQTIGLQIDTATSSEEARQLLYTSDYELIISDIARGNKTDEGIRFLDDLVQNNVDLPLIFYVGFADYSKGIPPYAFGLTDSPDELLHLVLDVLERKY